MCGGMHKAIKIMIYAAINTLQFPKHPKLNQCGARIAKIASSISAHIHSHQTILFFFVRCDKSKCNIFHAFQIHAHQLSQTNEIKSSFDALDPYKAVQQMEPAKNAANCARHYQHDQCFDNVNHMLLISVRNYKSIQLLHLSAFCIRRMRIAHACAAQMTANERSLLIAHASH